MVINKKRQKNSLKIVINDKKIQSKSSVKYLRVHSDSKLNFNKHIAETITKAKMAIGILYKLLINKHIITKYKVLMYKMCIKPIMTYACPVWCNNTSKTNLLKLQRIQNKCLNIVLRNNRPNTKHIKYRECHKIAKIEYIDEIISKLSKKFYATQVNNIEIVKDYGKNTINSTWDKRKYSHQKYFH